MEYNFYIHLCGHGKSAPGARRLCYEAALHRALELNDSGGPILSGDAIQTNEWPTGFQMLLQEQLFFKG